VSANTVVEHLKQPAAVFREFARVLAPGGQFLLHTPNAYSYFVLVARLLPDALIRRLDGRPPEDISRHTTGPTHPAAYDGCSAASAFATSLAGMIASDAGHQRWRVQTIAELYLIRATMTRVGRPFRVSMIATARRRR
jgi:SAM-dependent methyltransferase